MNGLELHDILLTFPEGARRRTILDIPSCAVAPGECVALAGASGSGKSTFLNLISGLILPNTGATSGAGGTSASSFRISGFSRNSKPLKTSSCPSPSIAGASRKACGGAASPS